MRGQTIGAFLLAGILCWATGSRAQIQTDSPLQNTSPPTAVGSGARAMGSGGAFIAIADDATAATWNPGGLVQLLSPEMSLVVTNEKRRVMGEDTHYNEINHLSMVYPFNIGDVNFVSALGYQRLYDHNFQNGFDQMEYSAPEREGTNLAPDVFQSWLRSDQAHKIGTTDIQGSIGALSPSLAVQLTPRLSAGFTYNFWDNGFIGPDYSYEYYSDNDKTSSFSNELIMADTNGDCLCNGGPCDDTVNYHLDNPECLDDVVFDPGSGTISTSAQSDVYQKQTLDLTGQNFNLGILFKVSPRWTLGAVYRSEFVAKIDREFYEEINRVGALAPDIVRKKYHERLRFPSSYGMGAAFRYSDALTVSADVTRTEWDRFTLMPEHGRDLSPVSRLPMSRAEVDPTMTWRAGFEYLMIGPKFVVPLRAGFFYDPEPGYQDPDDYYGFSVGSGLAWERVIIDVAYWYRWGDDVTQNIKIIQDPYTLARKAEVEKGHINRQMVMLSAIIHLQ